MKSLILISLFFLDSLPPEPLLHAALVTFHQQQTAAELVEYQSTNKQQWLKYLPTIGLSYTLDGKPRPTVSWSSNLIYTSRRDKESKVNKQESILKKRELALQKDQLKLNSLIQKHLALKEDIAFMKKLFDYDTQLYEVKVDQAEHLEIPPVTLLKATQAYQKKEYAIFQKERLLKQLASEILEHAHYITQ